MGRKNTSKKETINFKEFSFESGANVANGRVYPDSYKDTGKAEIYGLSLTINGLVIRGCKLVVTDKSNFISFPQYKTKDGDYESLVFMVEKEDIEFLKGLANEIANLI